MSRRLPDRGTEQLLDLGEREYLWPIRKLGDAFRLRAFTRAAQHEHLDAARVSEVLREFRKRFGRPELRRSERRPGIQADHFLVPLDAVFFVDGIGSRF